MLGLKSALQAVLTCAVAFATVCALVLPEEDGGRDSFVRLTRSGVQRQCFTDSSCHGTDDSDTRVETPNSPALTVARSDAGHALAVLPSLTRVAPPGGEVVEVSLFSAGPTEHRHETALSDRAPPAR